MFLGDKPSLPVALTLVPIIGGVVLASTSELSFTWKGFLSGAPAAHALALLSLPLALPLGRLSQGGPPGGCAPRA